MLNIISADTYTIVNNADLRPLAKLAATQENFALRVFESVAEQVAHHALNQNNIAIETDIIDMTNNPNIAAGGNMVIFHT